MKKTDNPVIDVNVNGNHNDVKVKVVFTETSSRISAAIVIALGAIVMASVLAVSYCCPDLFADFVRWIISIALGS